MKFRWLSIVLFAAALSAAAQTGPPADLNAKVDEVVASAMRQQQIPAMTVAAAMDDRIVYSRAFGAADLENAVPATTGR
jgi:CubicO group peptidase (beta-lactamase class C family)